MDNRCGHVEFLRLLFSLSPFLHRSSTVLQPFLTPFFLPLCRRFRTVHRATQTERKLYFDTYCIYMYMSAMDMPNAICNRNCIIGYSLVPSGPCDVARTVYIAKSTTIPSHTLQTMNYRLMRLLMEESLDSTL